MFRVLSDFFKKKQPPTSPTTPTTVEEFLGACDIATSQDFWETATALMNAGVRFHK